MESHIMEIKQKRNISRVQSYRNAISWRQFFMSKLMKFKQFKEDDNWPEQAVKNFINKLKNKEGAMEELKRALSYPETPTSCITIPRTGDGFIRILNEKGHPHVISCRLWRWPDLQSYYELQSLPACQFPFSQPLNEVCINPYHYKRLLDVHLYPPVLIPKYNDVVPSRTPLPVQQQIEPTLSPTAACNEMDSIPEDSDCFAACSSLLHLKESDLAGNLELLPNVSQNHLSNINNEKHLEFYQSLLQESPLLPVQPTSHQEQPIWASITYYELNNRVGETFHCKSTTIMVDGYTNCNINGDRFSVGHWTNLEQNSLIEKTRPYIAKGIRLQYIDGIVYVECLSKSPVFVHSVLCNHMYNIDASTVCKILHEGSLKVFDNTVFSELLFESVTNGASSYESVFNLTKMCIIRLSFVKGWGDLYPMRPDITNTPTWIEIQLHEPLKWLDKVLVQMAEPNDPIINVV